MSSDHMSVRLHLRGLRVLEVLVDSPMNRPGFGGGSGARRVSLGRPRPWTPSIAQRRSGHRAAQLNNSSGVKRAARSLIVTASTDPGPIAVAVWEVLCGSIPITTVICRSSWLPNNGFHGGQPEFRKRSRLYRATPQRAATGPTRCERATPKWARNVRAQPVTDLAPYVPVETGMLGLIQQVRNLRRQVPHHCCVGPVPAREPLRDEGHPHARSTPGGDRRD